MRLKSGVSIDGLNYLLVYAIAVAEYARLALSLPEVTVTSGLDDGDSVGAARVRTSLHPYGFAVDLRTSDITPSAARNWQQLVRSYLGPSFHVVLEEDHLHIELQRPTLGGA